jgi:hypothetical protein
METNNNEIKIDNNISLINIYDYYISVKYNKDFIEYEDYLDKNTLYKLFDDYSSTYYVVDDHISYELEELAYNGYENILSYSEFIILKKK